MRHIQAEVLESYPSSKDPDFMWEVRRSHYDGKVYCTCPGWIFQARKKDGICKHIRMYLAALKGKNPDATIQIYTIEEYNNVLQLHRETGDSLAPKTANSILKIDRE